MPELVLDLPQIHKYAWKFVIHPLIQKKQMDLKFIKWDADEKAKTVDEDDIVFDNSDPAFKLMAHILVFQKANMGGWSKAVEWYEATVKWKDVAQKKYAKLEEPDLLWESI